MLNEPWNSNLNYLNINATSFIQVKKKIKCPWGIHPQQLSLRPYKNGRDRSPMINASYRFDSISSTNRNRTENTSQRVWSGWAKLISFRELLSTGMVGEEGTGASPRSLNQCTVFNQVSVGRRSLHTRRKMVCYLFSRHLMASARGPNGK